MKSVETGSELDGRVNQPSPEKFSGTNRKKPRVLVLASTFPSSIQPIHGVFVKERVKAVAALGEFDLRVMSPTPWFPPLKMFKRWYPLSQIPASETVDGLQVTRPRYLLLPKIGGYYHTQLMKWGIGRSVARLREEFPFDLIDAHFVYPDGVVGAMLGELYNVPVVMTARGEDMIRFPELPVIGNAIRWGLKRASQLVGLSEELAQKMFENGADPARVRVISNGVDTAKFRPVPRDEARQRMGLPLDRKIIIGVGYLLERKGFHLAVEALRTVRERHPDAMLVIVGGVSAGVRITAPRSMRRSAAPGWPTMSGWWGPGLPKSCTCGTARPTCSQSCPHARDRPTRPSKHWLAGFPSWRPPLARSRNC